jgi:aspartate carbamoyltransferase catalytic subunit
MKVDMIVIRHASPGVPVFLSKNTDVHIINAGDGAHEHPTQALLDAYSIREVYNDFKGLNVAFIGDIFHSRVAFSNIYCLLKLGANVRLCGPPTLIPKHIEELGVSVSYDLRETLEWADVANVLRIQMERADGAYFPSTNEYAQFYGINRELLDSLKSKVTIMHPGPINRGVELSSDVADSAQSIILDQVENGVAVRMAVTYLLFQNR